MDTRKKLLFCLMLIFIVLSCSKEDTQKEDPQKEEKIFTRPVGKYVSEIRACNNNLFMRRDTIKLMEFEYNANRYLKKLWYYSYITQELERRNEYIYNSAGQINQIDVYDKDNLLKTQDILTYQNQKLILSETYTFESGNKSLSEKYQIVTDDIGRVIEVFEYRQIEGSWVKQAGSRKFTFNSSGNVTKDLWQLDKIQRIAESDFDMKENPFYDLYLPYSYHALPYFSIIYTLSKNNYTGYNLTVIDPDGPGTHSGYVTADYEYEDNYPKVLNNTYFFKYIDLK